MLWDRLEIRRKNTSRITFVGTTGHKVKILDNPLSTGRMVNGHPISQRTINPWTLYWQYLIRLRICLRLKNVEHSAYRHCTGQPYTGYKNIVEFKILLLIYAHIKTGYLLSNATLHTIHFSRHRISLRIDTVFVVQCVYTSLR